jgi:hypothetical protein
MTAEVAEDQICTDIVIIPCKVEKNGKIYEVTSIGEEAFWNCSKLTSIEIPESVTNIGQSAFYGCKSLKTAKVPKGLDIKYASFPSTTEIIIYSRSCKTVSAEESDLKFTYNEETMTAEVAEPLNSGIEFPVIPCKVEKDGKIYDVTSIGGYAFANNTNLKSIVIPEWITNIGEGAFNGCKNLIRIVIPESVTIIEKGILEDCKSLGSIEIPNSVTSIGERAFANCLRLTDIKIPSYVTSIGDYAFGFCSSLEIAEVPQGLDISGAVFPSTTRIIRYAIDTMMYTYNEENMTAEVYKSKSNKETISIPSKVEKDGKIYDVTSIGIRAFDDCSSLTSIEIPGSVTNIGSIGSYAKLTSINVSSDNKNYTSVDGVLYNKNITELIACPHGLNSIVIPNSVTSIGNYAFSNRSKLTSIEIPNSVTSIGERAFQSCRSLTSIKIPKSVTSIGDYAFGWCSGLTNIEIPESVTSLGSFAFSYCSSLTSCVIPKGVTMVYFPFDGCDNIKTAKVPEGLDMTFLSFPETTEIIRY